MGATIPDIAKKAGVSTATVSRVINGYPFIKETTKLKVQAAIEELNYQPDLVARSMKKGKTNNIGLIIGGLSNPFFAETAEIIVKMVKRYNYHITLCVVEENSKELGETINRLITSRVDGIILGSIFKSDSIRSLEESNIPYVLYNRTNGNESANYIIQDNFKGAFDAVSHFIQLGHTRIGLLHGPHQLNTVEGRIKGYYEAMKTYNLKPYPHYIQEVDYNEVHNDLEKKLKQMFKKDNSPTAIFASADFLALDVMEFLIRNGYRIPEDVALIGFDNLKISGHPLINLTTVGHRSEEMARLASERIIQMIESKEASPPWKITLHPELVIRNSCGAKLKRSM